MLTVPDYVGMALFAGNVAYCVAALLSGWLTDAIKQHTIIMFTGLSWIAVGMYMFGPVGWPFRVQSDVVFVGLVVGFWGAGVVTVPLFPYLAACAGENQVRAAAMLCASHELGALIGHIVCTQLSHAFSIEVAMASWSAFAILLALWTAILSLTSKSARPRHDHGSRKQT